MDVNLHILIVAIVPSIFNALIYRFIKVNDVPGDLIAVSTAKHIIQIIKQIQPNIGLYVATTHYHTQTTVVIHYNIKIWLITLPIVALSQ